MAFFAKSVFFPYQKSWNSRISAKTDFRLLTWSQKKRKFPWHLIESYTYIWNGFYTWSQSKTSLLSSLIIGSKLTLSGWSDRWLPYSSAPKMAYILLRSPPEAPKWIKGPWNGPPNCPWLIWDIRKLPTLLLVLSSWFHHFDFISIYVFTKGGELSLSCFGKTDKQSSVWRT